MENEFKEGLKVDSSNISVPKLKIEDGDLYEINGVEKEEVYEHYICSQKTQFKAYLDYMNSILCILKHYGIVSDYTRFLARIKGIESAIKNDNKCKEKKESNEDKKSEEDKSKPLTDVFGLEVDTATEGEAAFVSEIFNSSLKRTRDIVYNKNNGYIAHHFSGHAKKGESIAEKIDALFNNAPSVEEIFDEYKNNLSSRDKNKLEEKQVLKYIKTTGKELDGFMKLVKRTVKGDKLEQMKNELIKAEKKYQEQQDLDDENQPIVECQIKTISVAISANLGSANHGEYKGDDIEQIQNEYDREGELKRNKLPYRMYRSNLGTDKNGNPKPFKLLSEDEMIKALYPSIILKSREEKEIE